MHTTDPIAKNEIQRNLRKIRHGALDICSMTAQGIGDRPYANMRNYRCTPPSEGPQLCKRCLIGSESAPRLVQAPTQVWQHILRVICMYSSSASTVGVNQRNWGRSGYPGRLEGGGCSSRTSELGGAFILRAAHRESFLQSMAHCQ